jgi:hypothetical protein
MKVRIKIYTLEGCYVRLSSLRYVTDVHRVKRKCYTVSIKDNRGYTVSNDIGSIRKDVRHKSSHP